MLTFGFRDSSSVLLHIQYLTINQITYLHTPNTSSERKVETKYPETKRTTNVSTEISVYTQGLCRGVIALNPGKQRGETSQISTPAWEKGPSVQIAHSRFQSLNKVSSISNKISIGKCALIKKN